MSKDFADFLASLNNEGVAYVVIGGMAVIRLVPYRTTRDIDVLIEPTRENAQRARRAVASWAGEETEFSIEDFLSGEISLSEASYGWSFTRGFLVPTGSECGSAGKLASFSECPLTLHRCKI